ncbi:hypothetical protein AOLI_G00017690 [Acnodon oligacanthus]
MHSVQKPLKLFLSVLPPRSALHPVVPCTDQGLSAVIVIAVTSAVASLPAGPRKDPKRGPGVREHRLSSH